MHYFDTFRKRATHKLTVSFAHVCEGQQTMTTLSGAETPIYDILDVSATDHGPIELKLTYNNQIHPEVSLWKWGTGGTEIKVSSVESPELTNDLL